MTGTPDTRLWAEVLLCALRDALMPPAKRGAAARDQREAEVWCRRGGEDFRTVCELAGVDPAAVRKWVFWAFGHPFEARAILAGGRDVERWTRRHPALAQQLSSARRGGSR